MPLEDIWVELEPLEAVVDLEKALDPDAPLVHDDLESNLAAHLAQEKGDYEAAREQADLVIKRRIVIDRCAAAAMENRGIVAHWEPKSQHLTMWDTTQAPIPIRNGLAALFGLSASQVRVIAPFVGGGFGPKIMMYYPEEVILTWATLQAGPAHQVDRGPAGELFRHHPGAGPGPLCRDGPDARMGASWASSTSSSTTRAPTIPTA